MTLLESLVAMATVQEFPKAGDIAVAVDQDDFLNPYKREQLYREAESLPDKYSGQIVDKLKHAEYITLLWNSYMQTENGNKFADYMLNQGYDVRNNQRYGAANLGEKVVAATTPLERNPPIYMNPSEFYEFGEQARKYDSKITDSTAQIGAMMHENTHKVQSPELLLRLERAGSKEEKVRARMEVELDCEKRMLEYLVHEMATTDDYSSYEQTEALAGYVAARAKGIEYSLQKLNGETGLEDIVEYQN